MHFSRDLVRVKLRAPCCQTKFYILWSLDFGVGVFHDFSRMNFGRNELMQG